MKLTKSQKEWRKSVLFANPDIRIFNDGAITIAAKQTGSNYAIIAWAIHGPNDGKFRRKTGEYVALHRLVAGQCLPVQFYNFNDIEYIMENIAPLLHCN